MTGRHKFSELESTMPRQRQARISRMAEKLGEEMDLAQLRTARQLSQEKLSAEQSKFEVGMSTNYFVVQAQRDLADAQNSELRAVLNYRKALVEMERVQSTTLQSLNITILGR